MGANARSTVGTVTDANAMLRVLFSRLGQPHVGPPNAFSFNVPSASGSGEMVVDKGTSTHSEARTFTVLGGMCPRCEGMGQVNDIDLAQLFDARKSLAGGALTIPGYTVDGWMVRIFSESGFLDPNKPICDYTEAERQAFLYHEPVKVKLGALNLTYEGHIPKIQKSFLAKDVDAMQPHVRAFVERAVTFTRCPDCDGTRLSATARSSRIRGLHIGEVCAMPITDLVRWLDGVAEPAVAPLLMNLRRTLEGFVEIGLGYLSLDRPSGSLSGGEAQRTRMIRHLSSSLTDVTYVFDEPTIGLHPHDIQRMNELLLRLRDKGNTVLVVEHKAEVIAVADHVVDIGPGAGSAGGQVVFQGSVDDLRRTDSATGRHLASRAGLKATVRSAKGALAIRGARSHNLQGVDVDVPLGVLVVVTGVAGSGKSSLIHGAVVGRPGVVTVDQSAIRGSRRSNPATYTGLLEPVRKAFAKAHQVKPALFSANSEGACPTCGGAGVIYVDLGMMAGVGTPCEDCEGRRFNASVLAYRLGGLDIAQVLDLSVDEAVEYFGAGEARVPAAHAVVKRLSDVGLGYLRLGQALPTLSGGARPRLPRGGSRGVAGALVGPPAPTTGLHPADLHKLLALLDRIVDGGRSVVVIEHHPAVMAHADWLIDLGPGAGRDGGRVVFEGTPRDLVAAPTTLTGQHLAAALGAAG